MARDRAEPGAPSGQRADARRNRDRILAAAEEELALHGAGASLEAVARRAGVGSATVHRHFRGRDDLLAAVFESRVEGLCSLAGRLADLEPAGRGLAAWLEAFVDYAAMTRGLAELIVSTATSPRDDGSATADCGARLADAVRPLVTRAQREGAVRRAVRPHDLLVVVSAVALAVPDAPAGASEVGRLVGLVLDGIWAPAPSGG